MLSLASRLSRDYALRHWQIQRPTGLLWCFYRIFGFLPAFDAIGRRPIADDVCHKAAAEEASTYSPRDASDGRRGHRVNENCIVVVRFIFVTVERLLA